jgi:EAL domain-containing protein (putative c-di-GMP-specific phosphodiesterase class I)
VSGSIATTTLDEILEQGTVHSVFQPIVHLESGAIVAYEALARGPAGPLAGPDQLFAEARRCGRLAELDDQCRRAAVSGAIAAGVAAPLMLFVNVEPEVIQIDQLAELVDLAKDAPSGLEVVLEVTERALAARPAELLACVEGLRRAGWRIALDDVGAEEMSLAFMAVLRPEVVKLDLRLVQDRPNQAIAEIMSGVNAYAERSGAVILAEGIEGDAELMIARAMGASLGQGWMLGRPGPHLVADAPTDRLALPATAVAPEPATSPFACLPAGNPLRRCTKRLLVEVSKYLEREAISQGSTCLLVAAFQDAEHFTPTTARRYQRITEAIAFTAALGVDLPAEPVPGVRGATLEPDDAIVSEWDIAVLGPQFAAALLAREQVPAAGEEDVPDMDRFFDFALTYNRDVVIAATHSLMSRVAARAGTPA